MAGSIQQFYLLLALDFTAIVSIGYNFIHPDGLVEGVAQVMMVAIITFPMRTDLLFYFKFYG